MSAPIRTCIDVSAIPPFPKGAGRYVVELVDSLAQRDDLSLTILSRHNDRARWTGGSSRVRALAPVRRPTRVLFGEFGLGVLIDHLRPKPEVFFGPHYTMPARCPVPAVVTIHDVTLIEHPEWHERSKVLFFRQAMRRAAQRAAGLIFVSEQTRARYFSLFSPVGKTFVIPHGVDHERFTPNEPNVGADAAVLERLGLSRPFVLAVGTIEPRKNHATLVRAFGQIAREDPLLSLVIAGAPGWGAAELDEAISSSEAREKIKTIGYVSDDDLAALYRSSQLVCYPSLEEGFGFPALEAMACGTALVTTAASAMDEFGRSCAISVIDPSDPGELAAALRKGLVHDQDRLRRGIEAAGRYSWTRSAEAHAEAFAAVAAR